MAKFSPTEAVFSGLRFARERPATLLIWAAYWLVAATVASLALFDLGGDQMTALIAAMQSPHPDVQLVARLMEALAPASGFALLLMVVTGSVLITAVLRVWLRPGPHSWGGLRLGGDELRTLGVVLAMFAITMGGELLAAVAGTLVATASTALAVVVRLAGYLLILALVVRLSLAPVSAMAEGRISLPRAFALTRGRFWPLLGAYVLLAAIMMVVLVLVMIVFGALMTASAASGGLNQLLVTIRHNYQDINPLMLLLYVLMNFAQIWVVIIGVTAGLAIGGQAYKAFLSEG